jgi:hypothetical protein
MGQTKPRSGDQFGRHFCHRYAALSDEGTGFLPTCRRYAATPQLLAAYQKGLFHALQLLAAYQKALFDALQALAAYRKGLFGALQALAAHRKGLFDALQLLAAYQKGLFDALHALAAYQKGLFGALQALAVWRKAVSDGLRAYVKYFYPGLIPHYDARLPYRLAPHCPAPPGPCPNRPHLRFQRF